MGHPQQGYQTALRGEAELCTEVQLGDLTHGRASKQGTEGHIRCDPPCVHTHACVCVRVPVCERQGQGHRQYLSVHW